MTPEQIRQAVLAEDDDAHSVTPTNGHALTVPNDPDACQLCHINPRRHEHSNYCNSCYGYRGKEDSKLTDQERKQDLMRVRGFCAKCRRKLAAEGSTLCEACLKEYKEQKAAKPKPKSSGVPLMPEDCMYGWCAEFARKMGAPLSAAYPAVVAVGAGYDVPEDPRVRSNLFVTIVGKTRTGKSATVKRVRDSWEKPNGVRVVTEYPGSEQGLILTLGGKKKKEAEESEMYPKPYLLIQDEMLLMFGKMGIKNSGLPYMLNHMFYDPYFGTSVKTTGRMVCAAKLTLIGGLTVKTPDDFAEVFGVETTTGLYGRTVFGYMPEGWEWDFETWKPPTETVTERLLDGTEQTSVTKTQRRAVPCEISAEAFLMAKDWVAEDRENRADLKELALRWALVTASYNHDAEVGEECMAAALRFFEWQQQLRRHYRPSEMDTPDGKVQQAIIRAMEQYEEGAWLDFRELRRKHGFEKGKDRNVTVLNRVKKAMIFEGILEEEYIYDDHGQKTKERTGKVRLTQGEFVRQVSDKSPTKTQN